MTTQLSHIYSPENIARSRARAAAIQSQIDAGTMSAELWRPVVRGMLADADAREAVAQAAQEGQE